MILIFIRINLLIIIEKKNIFIKFFFFLELIQDKPIFKLKKKTPKYLINQIKIFIY
jgi:hypothetical protein